MGPRPVAEEEEDVRDVVVCVDDEPAALSSLRRLFRRESFEVVTTDDPMEVLELIRERRVRLIIADQRMPEMPGTELLRAVRDRSPGTLGIVITGHADLGDIAAAMDDGAVQELVRKPWDDDAFKALIRNLLARQKVEDGGAAAGPAREREPSDAGMFTRVPCKGRRSYDVLDEICTCLRGPQGSPWRVVLEIEDLLLLGDSVTRFLADFVRIVAASGVRTALVDPSGTAEIFLQLMGGFVPLPVFRDRSELGARRRVLVVEHQADETEFLRRLIESSGHAWRGVRSLSAALDALEAEAFDLVVLDAPIAARKGADAVQGLIRKGRRIPVVALSSPDGRIREILAALRALARAQGP